MQSLQLLVGSEDSPLDQRKQAMWGVRRVAARRRRSAASDGRNSRAPADARPHRPFADRETVGDAVLHRFRR